jgi:Common central domain of tyrosinase/Polyphenol oxidase middle domain
MSSRSSGRRRISRAVSVGLVLLLGGGWAFGAAEAASATAPTTATTAKAAKAKLAVVHTRKEIHNLSSTEITNYRKGVALMQSRGFTDPTSWIYQANMHGYPTNNTICPVVGTPQPQWSTCQHGSFFFLAWHRMYLYYFERILQAAVRQAIGNPTYSFSLPFWNYESPSHRDLPEPFRNPANSSNPLYVAQRASNCNSGQPCVSAADASDTVALGLIPFCSCSGGSCTGCTTGISSDEAFGGGFIPAPNHSANGPGELEIQPHGQVHNAVGGPKGWMSFFTCAARDPIFWLHHANIDRLWQVWLNKTGGRKNPIANTEWANQTFTFFDENKQPVNLTGCQILNMATQLDYKYEGVAVNNIQLCTAAAAAAAEAPTAAPAPAPKVLAATTAAETRLGNAPVNVKVALPAEAGAHMRSLAAATPKPGRLRLAIEGIKVLNPGAVYQVYLNLPAGQKPDPAGPFYLGNISLFAEPEHSGEVTRTFDLSPRMKLLAGKGEVQLTIVREQLGAAAAGEPQEFLRFGRVSILER